MLLNGLFECQAKEEADGVGSGGCRQIRQGYQGIGKYGGSVRSFARQKLHGLLSPSLYRGQDRGI